ncbi:MAG: general secretion pathway protein GspK [Desulfobacteraceae bacterium]|jgi:general secretion pathway protein K|nr:MAG: general secretion pathway protein GspK [Desulfobacteraceae bacterium]
MRNFQKDNRGIALLLAVLVMGVLVAVALHFNVSMRLDLMASGRTEKGIKTSALAKSGLHIAVAALYEDGKQSDIDTVREPWAKIQALGLYSGVLFAEGGCEVKISDHCGRINVNRILDSEGKPDPKQRALLQRLLGERRFGIDSEEISGLLDAITDWLDEDDQITGFGAESSYYLSLANPYQCKNGQMDSLEELLLIRGVTREIYFGTDERPGISSFLTIHGDGRININTAGEAVLFALSEQIDRDMAERMVLFRAEEGNDLGEASWYKQVSGMGHVVIDSALIKTASDYFEITSRGMLDKMSKTIKATVKRVPKENPSVLSLKVVNPVSDVGIIGSTP